jgi:hypothetical protein
VLQTVVHRLGLKKGAVTPLACAVDKEKEVTFVLDKNLIEAGNSGDLLFHPTSGNECVNLNASQHVVYLFCAFRSQGCSNVAAIAQQFGAWSHPSRFSHRLCVRLLFECGG